jgi:hypothetical protein
MMFLPRTTLKNFIASCILLLPFYSYGQASATDEKYFNLLDTKCYNTLYFNCGQNDESSANIFCFEQLIIHKKYDLIKKLSNSQIPATQCLSVVAVKFLAGRNEISLDSITIKRIDYIVRSTRYIPYCSGCKEAKYILKDIFSDATNNLYKSTLFLVEHAYQEQHPPVLEK